MHTSRHLPYFYHEFLITFEDLKQNPDRGIEKAVIEALQAINEKKPENGEFKLEPLIMKAYNQDLYSMYVSLKSTDCRGFHKLFFKGEKYLGPKQF